MRKLIIDDREISFEDADTVIFEAVGDICRLEIHCNYKADEPKFGNGPKSVNVFDFSRKSAKPKCLGSEEKFKTEIMGCFAPHRGKSAGEFKGEWENLTGELRENETVRHHGKIWALRHDILDVALFEPTFTHGPWSLIYEEAEG